MEATELRIGNWVIVNEECQIEAIVHDAVCISTRFETYVLENVKPIPLTKEWLDKFSMFNGKEYAYGNYTLRKGNYAISDIPDISDRGWSIGIESSEEWMCLVCVKYVHQLQNAIFALTAGDVLTENKHFKQDYK